MFIERRERLSILLDTLCARDRRRRSNDRSNSMFWFYLFIHLAGELVAFDTTTENYTVPVSGKCILSCYVAEVRSFKVSENNLFDSFVVCSNEQRWLVRRHDWSRNLFTYEREGKTMNRKISFKMDNLILVLVTIRATSWEERTRHTHTHTITFEISICE